MTRKIFFDALQWLTFFRGGGYITFTFQLINGHFVNGLVGPKDNFRQQIRLKLP